MAVNIALQAKQFLILHMYTFHSYPQSNIGTKPNIEKKRMQYRTIDFFISFAGLFL